MRFIAYRYIRYNPRVNLLLASATTRVARVSFGVAFGICHVVANCGDLIVHRQREPREI